MPVRRPHPHFARPPVTEAVFDLFVAGSPCTIEQVEKAFFQGLPEFESVPDPWQSWVAQVNVVPGGMQTTTAVERRGVRRWNKDHTRGVLVGPDVFAFNVLPPYGHFDDLLPQISDLHHRFVETAKPQRVLWLGHRYINQVTLRVEDDDLPGALFTLYPKLPRAAEHSTHPQVSVVAEAARFRDGIVVVNLMLSALDAQNAVYTLDLYAKTPAGAPPITPHAMVEWHQRAHEEVRTVFLWCLTDKARSRFKEAKK